jgi:hypothetical protein
MFINENGERREETVMEAYKIGQVGEYDEKHGYTENLEAAQFISWWTRIKDQDRFNGRDKEGNALKGMLDKYDPYTLYPLFYEYAAFRSVDCTYARLWSMIDDLSRRTTYPRYPFYKVGALYWRVLLGVICGDKHNGNRLTFAANYSDLRNRPTMVFIRTFGIRLQVIRKRFAAKAEIRRIWSEYAKQNKLRGN